MSYSRAMEVTVAQAGVMAARYTVSRKMDMEKKQNESDQN